MLILASASPRRKELLAQAGHVFEVSASSIPEDHIPGEDPIAFAIRLAREKAQAVLVRVCAQQDENAADVIVLGADTIVVVDNEILGKPVDAPDAARMLRLLSGRSHQVITGVSVVSRAAVETAAEVTTVTFLTLSDPEIDAYVATGEPMDKAGAYGIQGYAARWIPRIHGCYFNVVGLPLALVASLIEGTHARLQLTGLKTSDTATSIPATSNAAPADVVAK